MIDIFVAIYIFLFLFSAGMSLLYYLKIRQASKEYLRAKRTLDDIVISFNKELQIHEEKFKEIVQKNNAKIDKALDTVARIEPKITNFEDRLKKIEESTENIAQDQEALKRKINSSLKQETEPVKATILTSVTTNGQESNTYTVPPIPLRKEKALSALTETETKILELLANQGEKTAIQIRNEIKLTREHTARLMKKLFISGYIERRTDRTPYVYRLKKEMEGLLEPNKT